MSSYLFRFIGYSAWFLFSSGISLSCDVDFGYPWDIFKDEVSEKIFDTTEKSMYSLFKLIFCLASAVAMLFGVYWMVRRQGPCIGYKTSKNNKFAKKLCNFG